MKLDIVIPSRNRLDKLKVCLESIENNLSDISPYRVNVKIYVDTEDERNNIRKYCKLGIVGGQTILMKEEYRASRFWNSYLKTMEADILCYLNDDVKLSSTCLRDGLMDLCYLDYDGIVGFYQSNQVGTTNCNAAFGLIGSKFADRFPDRKVFCEDYYCLYLDEELMKYASSINKFTGSTKATLEHYHPVFTKELPDETHKWLRRYKQRDIKVHNMRKAKNLIWGNSFERITTD